MDFSWMAWSPPTATFFIAIGIILTGMGVLHVLAPSRPRVGILGFATQRGDRLFVSLLSAGYIHLAWLAFTEASLWFALAISAVFAILVFRFV